MVEGLELTVERRYGILRDRDFVEQYKDVVRVAKILDTSIRNGNSGNVLGAFKRLGVRGLGDYLEKLKDGDKNVRAYYFAIARVV